MAYSASELCQAASPILGWPASPSLPETETLILDTTTIWLGPLSTMSIVISDTSSSPDLFTDTELREDTVQDTFIHMVFHLA